MITGFNTDIEYGGITYHIQTEDKGLETPLLLSLVYTGGEILASKRAPYQDLISIGFDEKVLQERLNKQHRLICAAVKGGRIDDLRKMSGKNAATAASAKLQPLAETAKSESKLPEVQAFEDDDSILEIPSEIFDVDVFEIIPEIIPAVVEVREVFVVEPQIIEPEMPQILNAPTFDELQKPEALHFSLPPQKAEKPVTATSPSASNWRSEVQETIADFGIVNEKIRDSLALNLLDDQEYRGGDRTTLKIRVSNGEKNGQVVSGAEIIVKVLGAAFRPLIFHAKTDINGLCLVHLQLPHFKTGRAAILIRATFGTADAELRRIVTQG